MRHLNDDLLLETYQKACELELNDDFIFLITQELERRSIADRSAHLKKLH
ncbi:sporulation histidine kinase inhibitor Sda [Bacillus sp. H-16]|uniref:Sporulation histidine kinase inhibitor Sda n=2 Tax=Alteribacter keqinensis TaxID=2483800 RepID=A0A3M7TY55_9BACI|nr:MULTISPECIES: sporulation histidine kinase inhibitor Sda [Alteribacter]MBM7097144.1 sporulation histidine kinase inhibitor Sda [Alteribacter salitolerans]RNA70550.1 sporulation histidine kinase inhibitor Sda [Alteribacter keqinensis]